LLISLFGTVYSQNDNLTKGNNSQNNDNDDSTVNELIQLIGVLGGIAIPTAGARFIVNNWQQKKETSEIRKEILVNFQESIKDYIVLMDTFVAKILLRFTSTNEGEYKLNDILPYGYKLYGHIQVPEIIQSLTFSVPDRNLENEDFLESEFKKFEEVFFNKRGSVTKFLSGVRQYYEKEEILTKKVYHLWDELMILHHLICIIMRTKNQNEFVSLVKEFNTILEMSFEEMKEFDHLLVMEKIIVN